MKLMEFFSEKDGKFSMGRLLMCVVVIVYLFIAVYVGIETKSVPDIPVGVVGLITLLYGVNKFSVKN